MTATDLLDVFGDFFFGLEEQRPVSADTDFFHHCFGCGPSHPTGLRVRCFRTPEGVVSPVFIAREYAGPPNAAHGGIVTAYLDEICAGAALDASGKTAVTGELTVRFVAPVPVERAILGRGQLVKDHGRYVDVEARLEEFETRRLLATAKGRFFPAPARS
jgi:acyl-coenzyme A thioesterase PaaI-like protein